MDTLGIDLGGSGLLSPLRAWASRVRGRWLTRGLARQSAACDDRILVLRALRDHEGRVHDFAIRYANAAALADIGWDRAAVCGRRLLELATLHPLLLGHYYHYLEVVQTGRPFEFDAPCVFGPRRMEWLSVRASRHEDSVLVAARRLGIHGGEQSLLRAAMYDDLTGLPNRRAFRQLLDHACQIAAGDGQGVAVLFCDLDDLKLVNDTRGHAGGDAMLRAFADALREAIPATASVARLGGDEFVVLLEQLPGRDAAQAALDAVRACVDRRRVIDGESLPLRASIGMDYAPGGQADAQTLLLGADAEMYREKRRRKSAAPLDAIGNPTRLH